jgi:hypothetical protein
MQMVGSNGLSSHLHCVVSLTESCWRQMAEPRLPSHPVVEDLDVLSDLTLCLFAG